MSKEKITLALEALKDATLHIWLGDKKGVEANVRAHKNIKALEEALAKQEQSEPVAWMDKHFTCDLYKNKPELDVVPLYTTPQPAQKRSEDTTQQKPWVGLTDEERVAVLFGKDGKVLDYEDYAEAIEAKLKEKNNG